jgi:hypothetical protein
MYIHLHKIEHLFIHSHGNKSILHVQIMCTLCWLEWNLIMHIPVCRYVQMCTFSCWLERGSASDDGYGSRWPVWFLLFCPRRYLLFYLDTMSSALLIFLSHSWREWIMSQFFKSSVTQVEPSDKVWWSDVWVAFKDAMIQCRRYRQFSALFSKFPVVRPVAFWQWTLAIFRF